MEVKLLVSRVGAGFSQSAGEIIQVSDAEGLRMIEAGQAVAANTIEKTNSKRHYQKSTKSGK